MNLLGWKSQRPNRMILFIKHFSWSEKARERENMTNKWWVLNGFLLPVLRVYFELYSVPYRHYFQCYGPPFDQRMTKKCFRILQRIFIHHSNLLRISSRCQFWHGQSIRKLAPTIKMYGGFWYGNEVVGISQIDKFSHVTWYWMFVVVQWFNPKTKRNATLNFTSPNWNFI